MHRKPRISRRSFLHGFGSAGAYLSLSPGSQPAIAKALQMAARERAKAVSLLEDGGFTGSAWGWQFTAGATQDHTAGQGRLGAIHVRASESEYARFLVLGPTAGKPYTLAGWVRTQAIEPSAPDTGAYFATSQFEFQGRPTEFTVDGKQAVEVRAGNLAGTSGWKRFSQTVICLPTTAWFEVVVGLFRCTGEAWFSGLTFTEGATAHDLADTVSPEQAMEWAHRDHIVSAPRKRPRAAILSDPALPIRGAATSPQRFADLLRPTHDHEFLTAKEMAAPGRLSVSRFDLLVLPYGETFPLPAAATVLDFLAAGGDLFTSGGYAFQSPVVLELGQWRFRDEVIAALPPQPNLLPMSLSGWKPSNSQRCTLVVDRSNAGPTLQIAIAPPLRIAEADWQFTLPAQGEGKQYLFSAMFRATEVLPAPNGSATLGVEQLDGKGELAYAARITFAELRGTHFWQRVEQLFYLVPDCASLRVRLGLSNATGVVEAHSIRLELRPPAVRLNTALGWPEDSLTVTPQQLGIFDADYTLRRVASITSVSRDGKVPIVSSMNATGYAASGVVGMNHARWLPVIEAHDSAGRRRGAAGALMHHHRGPYARSSWAFFGVDSHDLFAPVCEAGLDAFQTALKMLTRKCFLHGLETNFSAYRDEENVRYRVLASNFGRHEVTLHLRTQILDNTRVIFSAERPSTLRPGQTFVLEQTATPFRFEADHYRLEILLLDQDRVIDTIETGFNIWRPATLALGMPIEFKDNYFHVEGQSIFLQGTDDYLHTFIDQDENAGTWLADARGCRDSALDVYENLLGLRGPQHKPTETWWRWVDAMLLNTQSVGGIFFPGMLVFSNTAVGNLDLEDQKNYVRAFAARYRDAAGIMYYLNGDLELHDPNLPDLKKIYNDFLRAKYPSDAILREAWSVSPPEGPLGTLSIRRGTSAWNDIRTLDDFRFRTMLVRRWLNAVHDAIREADTIHPITAEFYQSPVSGIDLLTALGKLDLANFGYFAEKEEDRYRFPQICRFLDQSMRGKGINVGEFGVKTHPAWNDTGYYIEARSEQYEQRYFLSLSHYAFALGASKIQNWCWKYPADLPFEWGLNYPNEMVPRDTRAFYRNSGLLFRMLRPRYEVCPTVMLLASDSRMGGQGHRIVEGQLTAIRLLLDQNIRFATLTDEFLAELPPGTRTIFYPLSFCPSDEIVDSLKQFVENGGRLYLSGDLSLDSLRRRTRTSRLRDLCGVDFASEQYANLEYGSTSVTTVGTDSAWPIYQAAPTMRVTLHGARSLLSGVDGEPIVTEYRRGNGVVIFSADPLELHGDSRYQPYAHQFYRALCRQLDLASESLNALPNTVHCFRVPTQSEVQTYVLVNYSDAAQSVSIPTAKGKISLQLLPHVPGLAASVRGGITALESSGDVYEDGTLLLSAELHAMLIAFGQKPLRTATRVLLLPMGVGSLTLHQTHSFTRPVILSGEIENGYWKQYSRTLVAAGAELTFLIDDAKNLSMLLLCEADDMQAAIGAVETFVNTPWKLEEHT